VYYSSLRFFIGNMGNPIITRLGKSQLWYKNWYTDRSNYSHTIKSVYTFQQLLNIYFNYGIFRHKNIFIHNFWYRTSLSQKILTSFIKQNLALYFRKYFYSHNTLTIEHSYFLRLTTLEYFNLKLYVLKYNHWLIISVQWFKPIKKFLNKPSSGLGLKNSRVSIHQTLKNTQNSRDKRSILFLKLIYNIIKSSNISGKYIF
jgi:hypothetical protein